jgi:hypothetical protein
MNNLMERNRQEACRRWEEEKAAKRRQLEDQSSFNITKHFTKKN